MERSSKDTEVDGLTVAFDTTQIRPRIQIEGDSLRVFSQDDIDRHLIDDETNKGE